MFACRRHVCHLICSLEKSNGREDGVFEPPNHSWLCLAEELPADSVSTFDDSMSPRLSTYVVRDRVEIPSDQWGVARMKLDQSAQYYRAIQSVTLRLSMQA